MPQGLCRLQLHLPPSDKDLPSQAALARITRIDTEELFDGPLYAQYRTTRNLLADDKDGCKIKVYQMYSAPLETSCARRWSGSAGSHGIDVKPMRTTEDTSPLAPKIRGLAHCDLTVTIKPDLAEALQKTSRQSAGLGASCLWSNETSAHLAEAASGRPAPEEVPLSGSCYFADLPYYPYTTYKGSRRRVVLQVRLPRRTGDPYLPIGMAYGTLNYGLKEFSIGTPIPASRFSRSAAEAFLQQPAVLPLENPPE